MKNLYLFLCFIWVETHAQDQLRINAATSELDVKQRVTLNKYLSDYTVIDVDVKTLKSYLQQHKSEAKIKLAISGSNVLDLTLEEYDIRASNYKAHKTSANGAIEDVHTDACYTYRGYLNNDPNQFVRLSVTDKTIRGLLFDKLKGYLSIEPLTTFEKLNQSQGKYVLYNMSSLRSSTKSCGVNFIKSKLPPSKPNGGRQMAVAINPCRIVEIATDADYEYFLASGNNTFSEILSTLNVVDGIYQSTFNLRIVVVYQHMYTSASDPYTSSDGANLLDEFSGYWNANRSAIKRDLAYLFTARQLSDVYGITYGANMCSNLSLSYALTDKEPNDYYTTAHEIGHNFGAQHPEDVGYPEACSPTRTIMCTGSNIPNAVFHSFSQNQINAHLASNNSCLFSGAPVVEQTYLNSLPISVYSINEVCTYNTNSITTTIEGLEGLSGAGASWQLINSSNGALITGSSNGSNVNFYSGTSSGSFNLKLNMTNACGFSQAEYFFNATNCPSYYRYTVYPNPASEYVIIEFENNQETKDYPEQFDLIEESMYGSGQPVRTLNLRQESTKQTAKNTRQLTINVKDLPRGRYILRVTKEKEQKDKKVDAVRISLE